MKQWFKMQVEGDVAEIHIIDFIGDWVDDYFGFGVTAKQFVDDLSKIEDGVKTIRVHINSPGGDVFAAVNMANALRQQREKGRDVEVIVDGLAASAATLVMMAGAPIKVADNAVVMIHNPWGVVAGDAAELRKNADVLDQVRESIIATYKWNTKLSDAELIDLMDAETWMDADEAVARGFAHEKVSGIRAAASIDPRHVEKLDLKVPEKFKAQVQAFLAPPVAAVVEATKEATPPAAAAKDVLEAVAAAGLDVKFALALVGQNATSAEVAARVAVEKERLEAESSRRKEIGLACDKFKVPGLATDLIEGGTSAPAARSIIAKVTAMVDRVEIDAAIGPDGAAPSQRKSGLNPVDIYAQRNAAR